MLRKVSLTVLSAIAIVTPSLILHAKSAIAQDLAFTLLNSTDQAITEFYTSPVDVNNWEEDILGVEVLPGGSTATVSIEDGRTACVYDIKVVFEDGDVIEDRAIDFCNLDGGSYEFTGN